jgi:hypothetical protein
MPHTKTRDYSSKGCFVRTLLEKFARAVFPGKTTDGFLNKASSQNVRSIYVSEDS